MGAGIIRYSRHSGDGGVLRQGFFFITCLSLCISILGTIRSLFGSCIDEERPISPAVANNDRYVLPSLEKVASSKGKKTCDTGFHYVSNNVSIGENLVDRKIPRIIHQTSKSRCVTSRVLRATKAWQQSPGFSYFFHDDEAVHKLFALEFPEFPHLNLVTQYCVVYGTLKADLWRYLVLWVYGGIYADLDAVPATFNPETSIKSDDEAFFVVEQYHLLSQWFIAVSPRHPLMFYAIHHSLANLLRAKDTGSIPGMW
jgi:mannosyltransferase OCH1-like enzyme